MTAAPEVQNGWPRQAGAAEGGPAVRGGVPSPRGAAVYNRTRATGDEGEGPRPRREGRPSASRLYVSFSGYTEALGFRV